MNRTWQMAGVKVKTGQVFAIPLGTDRYGLGQIVAARDGELYLTVYGDIFVGLPRDPHTIIGKRPVFSALSLDAKLWHGHWPVIGVVTENLSGIAEPIFKVGYAGALFLESRAGSMLRQTLPGEAEQLRFRTVVAPVWIEDALKAHHGLEDWNPKYDELLYDYAVNSTKLMPS
jgi:hypothetical protein